MYRFIARLRRRVVGEALAGERGFTMVEMVMAIFIFALVVTGLAVGMSSSLNLTRQNRNRSIAANLASQQMDTVRTMDFSALNDQSQLTQPTVTTQSVDSVPYTVSQYTRWIYKNETGATAGPCQSPPTTSNPLAYISVAASISWTDMHGVPPVTSNTVVTPPVGIYDQTDGHIAVTVLKRDGSPAQGVTVSISSTGVSDSAVTSTDGCAFFAFEPIGTYTVSVNAAGAVDGQGNGTPSQTTTVKAASTSSVQFQLDSAATLTLTLQGNGGYSVPSSVPVSLGNTHLLPSGTKAVSGSGSPRTISGLFPYSDGYQAWAGACSDADPQGIKPTGGAYYSGATRDPAITVTPGQTSTGTVNLPAALLQFKRSSGSGTGYSVTATHVVPAGVTSDPGCPTAETYTLATGLTIGTSNVSVQSALPFGTWTITVLVGATVKGTETITLSPLNANNPFTPSVLTVT